MMHMNPSRTVPEAVGKAIIAFSELDLTLGYGVAFLILKGPGADDVGRIFGTCMSVSERIAAMEMAFHLRVADHGLRDRMGKLADELRQANILRNRLVHDEWFWSRPVTGDKPDYASLARVSKKGDMYPENWLKEVDLKGLDEDVDRFQRLASSIHRILIDAERSWRVEQT